MQKEIHTPAISVIMPVYNASAYLRESVGSVLGQTYGDFELICFNDASTDDSLAVLRSMSEADARVRIIDSAENVRQGGGRNRAIKEARGRYVVFLDADDMLRPQALEKCMEAAGRENAEVVFFDYERFAPTAGTREPVSQLGEDAARLSGDDLRLRVIERTAPLWSAMYARKVIVDNELWFPEGVFYEDNAVAIAMQLVAANPVKINEVLYSYRCDNESVSRSYNEPRFFDRIGSAVTMIEHLRRLRIYRRFPDSIDWLFANQFLIHTVYGAIYRFYRLQFDRIQEVRWDVGEYIADFRRCKGYRSLSLMGKLKIESHLRFPRLIKFLSNINRKISRKLPLL